VLFKIPLVVWKKFPPIKWGSPTPSHSERGLFFLCSERRLPVVFRGYTRRRPFFFLDRVILLPPGNLPSFFNQVASHPFLVVVLGPPVGFPSPTPAPGITGSALLAGRFINRGAFFLSLLRTFSSSSFLPSEPRGSFSLRPEAHKRALYSVYLTAISSDVSFRGAGRLSLSTALRTELPFFFGQ